MKGGILIIGSLIWDNNVFNRGVWWKNLNFNKKRKVLLPIRYGRASSENRRGTYSMVFSKSFENSQKLGVGYFVPFLNEIFSTEELNKEIIAFAKAEGFKGDRIAARWGTVCIKTNPEISKQNSEFVLNAWNELVHKNKNNRTKNQTIPDLNDFGESNETKSITENWILNLNDNIFTEMADADFLLTTSNALKHRKTNEIKYPCKLEIAKAMVEENYFEYFLKNRLHGIKTNEDRIILKILRKRFKINLKDLRKNFV